MPVGYKQWGFLSCLCKCDSTEKGNGVYCVEKGYEWRSVDGREDPTVVYIHCCLCCWLVAIEREINREVKEENKRTSPLRSCSLAIIFCFVSSCVSFGCQGRSPKIFTAQVESGFQMIGQVLKAGLDRQS